MDSHNTSFDWHLCVNVIIKKIFYLFEYTFCAQRVYRSGAEFIFHFMRCALKHNKPLCVRIPHSHFTVQFNANWNAYWIEMDDRDEIKAAQVRLYTENNDDNQIQFYRWFRFQFLTQSIRSQRNKRNIPLYIMTLSAYAKWMIRIIFAIFEYIK